MMVAVLAATWIASAQTLRHNSADVLAALSSPVDWIAAAAMRLGCLVGRWAGPQVATRHCAGPFRVVPGVGGLVPTVWPAPR
jgi:hypothetical protein